MGFVAFEQLRKVTYERWTVGPNAAAAVARQASELSAAPVVMQT